MHMSRIAFSLTGAFLLASSLSVPGALHTFYAQDTYVHGGNTNDNYSTKTFIQLRLEPEHWARKGLLRFEVTGLTNYISSASLRMRSQTLEGMVLAHEITDHSWSPSTVTWSTKPEFGIETRSAAATSNNWFEIDVTDFVAGNGTNDIGLNTDITTTATKLYSSEGGYAPELIIVTGGEIPTNQPPSFTSDPIIERSANPDISYFATLADNATDPEDDILTFSKLSGPGWLTVASGGGLTGTPSFGNLGTNSFMVQVSDPDGSNDVATLLINVTNEAPSFASDPILEVDALTNTVYSSTLFNDARDPENDTMTFTKLGGPSWLTIATNGLLGGVPGIGDLGTNTFSVQVDATGGSDTATLLINVTDVPPPEGDSRPNILFIEVDDLVYSYLSSFGSQVNETPHIDSLASSGVSFWNAMAPGMMCGPSRNCFITGLYPHNLGMYKNGQMSNLQRRVWTYPAALRRAGYFTAYIGKSHIRPYTDDALTNALAEELGFDYAPNDLGRAMLLSKPADHTSWYFDHLREKEMLDTFLSREDMSTLPEEDYLDGFYTRAAMDFMIDYNQDKPFLLWLNLTLPHGPVDVSAEYQTFDPTNMPGGTVATYISPSNLVASTKNLDPADPDDLDTILEGQAGHCANTAFMDQQVGHLNEVLAANNMLDNTIVCFFSDHGLMMGAQFRQKKGSLFRPITNPTLIVSWPAEFLQNVVVSNVVELQDLLPTVLEIANASEADKAVRPNHKSLIPLLTDTGTYERTMAFSEIHEYVVVTSNRYRFIQGPGANFLFDDMADPHNLTNIAATLPGVSNALDAAATEWLTNSGPYYTTNALDPEALALSEIPLDSPSIYVHGAPYTTLDTNGLTFLRFEFPTPEQRTTEDVMLTFLTRSENVYLNFVYLPGDPNTGSLFEVHQNGEYIETISVDSSSNSVLIELVSQQYPGTLVRYDLHMPDTANPILSKLELKEGLVLEEDTFISYEVWASEIDWGGSLEQGLEGDPDEDGLQNAMEYALKRSPVVADLDSIPSLYHDGSNTTASVTLGLGSDTINYMLYLSNDLLDGWDTIPPQSITGTEDETVVIPIGDYGTPLFLRLGIELY